jgi:hypothetical protein
MNRWRDGFASSREASSLLAQSSVFFNLYQTERPVF